MSTQDKTALPPGLTIRKKGESLETVSSKAIEVQLLVAGQGMEILEGGLNKGERITLVPSGEALETYYILEGQLRCDLVSGSISISPGDYLVTESLTESYTLLAQTDVRFIYFTSKPTFHEISQELGELMRLAVEVEIKDGYTAEHCRRLQILSYATGQELGLAQDRLYVLDYGAYLHDVGKVKVPVGILQKPSALTKAEWVIMKKHPIYGRELLEKTYLKKASTIVEQHHERLDGSGYPYGLSKDEILIESYIVAVADTYDAMTTDRPYRGALPPEEAFAELRKHADIYYPKEVVKAFISIVKRKAL